MNLSSAFLLRKNQSLILLSTFFFFQIYITLIWYAPELLGKNPTDRRMFVDLVTEFTQALLILGLSIIAWSASSRRKNNSLMQWSINPAILLIFPYLFFILMSLKKNDLVSAGNPTWITMVVLILATWIGLRSERIAIEGLLTFLSFLSLTHLCMIYLSQPQLVANLTDSTGLDFSAIRNGIRALGVTFNAGFLGIAQVVSIFTCAAYLANGSGVKKTIFQTLAWLTICLSLVSLYLSGSRLPALGVGLGVIYITFSSRFAWAARRPKFMLGTYFFSFISLGFIVPRVIGLVAGSPETANFSGRLDLWQCVIGNAESYLPFGVGAEAARKSGFCAQLDWSHGWRHAESISLTGLVEFGIPGFLIWPIVFILLLPIVIKSAKNGYFLGAAIFIAFVVLGETGGMLSSYLPIIGSSAPRGIFNFFIYILIWVYVLKYEALSQQSAESRKKVANLEQM